LARPDTEGRFFMSKKKLFIRPVVSIFSIAYLFLFLHNGKVIDDRCISYIVDTKQQDIKLYWKDDRQESFKSIENLKIWLAKNQKVLVFAMNGGMYKQDNSPLGLFIEDQKTVTPLNTANANGNFYLKPNGVFYITTIGIPAICPTEKFKDNGKINMPHNPGRCWLLTGKCILHLKKVLPI
jgi:uncharacterized protein YigE (DUF2233 family)